ncbi:MAG: DUF4383 domain-containing protein [Candidatus Eremiobacteraeota bacterium]|nr:DUF4383 domain-containing protein [Candidatus Eremiobacteraeota bacterium]
MAVRRFALIFGALYVVLGLLGFVDRSPFVEGSSFDNFGPGGGYLIGQFPVNYVHDAIHALIGVWGLASSRSFAGAVTYGRALDIFYLVLGVVGAISFVTGGLPTDPIVPIGGLDVILHLVSGAVALFFGFGRPSRAPVRAR